MGPLTRTAHGPGDAAPDHFSIGVDNATVGWGKEGLACSIRSVLDREHARRAAGWNTMPDAEEAAA